MTTETQEKFCRILSIDAWGNNRDGYEWNNWYKVGEISLAELEKLKTNRQLFRWLRDNNILSEFSAGKVSTDDDQYNIVILDRSNNQPLFAIEYGCHY